MCSKTRHATTASNDPSGERQRRSPGSSVGRSPAALVGHPDLVPRRVDADDPGAQPGQQPADLPVTAAEIEHPTEAIEFRRRERQDLFDVLRVGALGESLDPPVRVRLPQLMIRWHRGGLGVARHQARGYGRRS